jgi:DNA recombination protein RmuC
MDAISAFLVAGVAGALLVIIAQVRQTAALRVELNDMRGRADTAENRAAAAQAAESMLREQLQRSEQSVFQLRSELNSEREQAARQISDLRERSAAIEARTVAEAQAHADKIAVLESAEQRLRDSFAQLSGEALKQNQDLFLQLAEERLQRQQAAASHGLAELVQPLRDTLQRQEQQVKALEEARQAAYGGLDAILADLRRDQQSLRTETARLTEGLRNPTIRGRWGEIQLRRLVEFAGMLERCDFDEQVSTNDGDKTQRPDMIVHLPNQRKIIVDAKVPLAAFLTAFALPEADRAKTLVEHAKAVRGHIDMMSKRNYPQLYDGAYEFTVIFLPGEVFFQAALEHDGDLLEYALQKNVLITSPSTLIAVLKSAALGWREATLADSARQVQKTARDIYDRMAVVGKHLNSLSGHLRQSVDDYNDLVGSIEGRLMPSLREMQKLGVSDKELPELGRVIEKQPRALSNPLLLSSSGSVDGSAVA